MTEPVRVLIVDDNEDHAHLESEYLRLAGAFVVEVAVNLAELWQRLTATVFDVVLLDYNLPDGDGLQALSEIAARGYRVPVVMVTGRGDERVAAQAIQRGAVEYLVKNSDYLRTLPALVHKAIRHHQLMLSAQESLEKIRYQALLLDNVRDTVVVWNLEGRITFWNRAAEDLFGLSAGQQVGRPVSTYLSAFHPAVDAVADEAAGGEVERQVAGRQPEAIWIGSRVTALHDERGRRIGYMDVCRDITARKRLEAQIRAAQVQLAQAARLTAIGELASGVAHQISNPLTSVIGEAQLLLGQLAADHPARESAETIERAGWRAQAVVKRLMEFSRPQTGTLRLRSVNESIERALMLVKAHYQWIGVDLQLDLAQALPPVQGNARQLEDLWVNLLLAARDTPALAKGASAPRPPFGPTGQRPGGGPGPEGGASVAAHGRPQRLRVCSEYAQPDGVNVSVNIEGAVVPPEDLPSIFEPDFLEPVNAPGRGLALSICREIVRQHNGRIAAASHPDRGTTFTVYLPAERAEAAGG